MIKWRQKGRELEIKIPVANIQGYVYIGTHPFFLFLIVV